MVATIAASTTPQRRQSEYYFGGCEPAGRWILKANDFGVADGSIVDIALVGRLYASLDEDGQPLPINLGDMSWLTARLSRVQIKTCTRDPALEYAKRAAERDQSRSFDRG